MEYVISELNNDKKATINYLTHIHYILLNLTCYVSKGGYESSFQALYSDFYFKELLNREWGSQIISVTTCEELNKFQHKWKDFVSKKPFAYSSFVFYDEEYRNIVIEYLLPALNLLENDFLNQRILEVGYKDSAFSFRSYKEVYDPKRRLPDEEVIWSVSTLFELLVKHKILNKPNM